MQMPIESLNLQMLNVGLAKHDKDWNWQNVNSPFTRIYCVTKGEAWLHLPTAIQKLQPGHLYIVPAYTLHSYECSGVFEHYYLHVFEGFKKEADILERYDLPTEVVAQEGDERLMEAMCRRHPEAQLPSSNPEAYDNTMTFNDYVRRYNDMPLHEKMQLRGATLILLSRFMEHAKEKHWIQDKRMMAVLTHIHQFIYEDINIDHLAEIACLTRFYFIRTFTQELGMSPLQYINRKKVERAQVLLLTEDMTVKELAYTLGFSDHSYFIRLFRKITGRTPKEYRKTMR